VLVLHICIVCGTFLVVRNLLNLVEEANILLLATTLFLFTMEIIVTRLECSFLGLVVSSSENVRKALLRLSSRKRYVYKTARSFRTIQASVTDSFFRIDNSTFLEIINVAADHIVNLLCFKGCPVITVTGINIEYLLHRKDDYKNDIIFRYYIFQIVNVDIVRIPELLCTRFL